MSYQLEICTFNIDSAIVAARYPVHRIELCTGFEVGGTTPGAGMLQVARQHIQVPVYPIIRPRGGDFLYSDIEFDSMLADIELCKHIGMDGIVTGVQLEDGTLDISRMKELIRAAYPLPLSCHRVFDGTPQPLEDMEALIELGVERILTSGQAAAAWEGIPLIRTLVEKSAGRIEIMPGAGITSKNLREIAAATGATVFHASAKKMVAANRTRASSPVEGREEMAVLDEEELQRLIVENG